MLMDKVRVDSALTSNKDVTGQILHDARQQLRDLIDNKLASKQQKFQDMKDRKDTSGIWRIWCTTVTAAAAEYLQDGQ